MIANLLGKNIRQYRLAHNWTQEHLAGILSISHQVISKWENGLTMPDIDTLCTVAQLFAASLDELCGITPKQVDIVIEEIEQAYQADNATYDSLYSKWNAIEKQLSAYPTHENLLFSALKLLRAMHDTVETEAQRHATNTQILKVSEHILDFSKNDSHRSFAHYNLALYYSALVANTNSDEQNKIYADKAMSHADLVLYKDMHKTFYYSFSAANPEEERTAREKTLVELLDATKRACENLIRHYSHHGSERTRAIQASVLFEMIKVLEMFTNKLPFSHSAIPE